MSTPFADHYEVLELDIMTATTADVQNKYDLAIMKCLPEDEDCPACRVDKKLQAFKVQLAYNVLSDEQKRWEYDSTYHEDKRLSLRPEKLWRMTEYDILFVVMAEEVRKIVEYAIEIRGLVHEATEWWPKVQRHIQFPVVYRWILSKAIRHILLLEDLKKGIDIFDSLMVRFEELSQGMMMGVRHRR